MGSGTSGDQRPEVIEANGIIARITADLPFSRVTTDDETDLVGAIARLTPLMNDGQQPLKSALSLLKDLRAALAQRRAKAARQTTREADITLAPQVEAQQRHEGEHPYDGSQSEGTSDISGGR